MSGPRVTSGSDSRQDYKTPGDFMGAVAKRFGMPTFDLAAHAGNHQFEPYFAPREFVVKVERGKTDLEAVIADVVRAGADRQEAHRLAFEQWEGITGKGKIVIPNRDTRAAALDALRLETGARRRWSPYLGSGLGWLNCEFADIDPWADACGSNLREDGVRSLLLTPAVFAGWHTEHVVGVADVYELAGRLCFDGKSPFPKDCRLSHFHPGATGKVCIWDWRRDAILAEWARTIPDLGTNGPGGESGGSEARRAAPARAAIPNARGVDGAAAIPRSENDGKGAAAPDRNATQTTHQGTLIGHPGRQSGVDRSGGRDGGERPANVGDQRSLFGGAGA